MATPAFLFPDNSTQDNMSEKENPVRLVMRLAPETAGRHELLRREVAASLNIAEDRVKAIVPVKRSIDARQRRVMVNLTADVHIDVVNEAADIARPVTYNPTPPPPQPHTALRPAMAQSHPHPHTRPRSNHTRKPRHTTPFQSAHRNHRHSHTPP